MAEKTISINNFQKGIGQSPYVGFEELRCLNTTDTPGVCYPNKALVKKSVAIVVDQIEGTCTNSNTLYGFSNENNIDLYKYSNPTWTELSGFDASAIRGIAFWKKFLILVHSDGDLDANDSPSTPGDWENTFDNISSGATDSSTYDVPTLIANNNVLYFGWKNQVLNLSEVDTKTFDPSDNTTWATDVYATLDLPEDLRITGIAELGGNLLIATRPSGGAINNKICYLFTWDKSSASYEQIVIQETGINYLISTGNLAYIQAGKEGEWYVTNGTSVEFYNKIPKALLPSNQNIFNGACDIWRNKIYFGVSYSSTGTNLGVWSLDIRTGAIAYEYIISTGEYGQNDGVFITSITVVNDKLVVCWYDDENSSFGSDTVGNAADVGYSGNKSYLVSQYYQLAGALESKASRRFDINLTKPCGASDTVKVYYRTTQNGAFTTEITELAMSSGDQHKSISKALTKIKGIQFKIVLNGDAELLNFEMTI